MSKREVTLLSKREISDIYDVPEFNALEKELYFKLSVSEKEMLDSLYKPTLKIFFILQLGYFKAKHRFFQIKTSESRSDIDYIVSQYFSGTDKLLGSINRERIHNQKRMILEHFKYRECLEGVEDELKEQYLSIMRRSPKPRNVIRELITYCDAQKILLPSYRKLQDLYTETFRKELRRISNLIEKFPSEISIQLDDLISDDEGILSLNDVRYDQRDFTYTEIAKEVEKVSSLCKIYEFCKNQIPELKLSVNAIRYYSNNVEQYPISRLRKMSKVLRYLHALCYIYTRYQVFVDNLITSFMHHVVLLKDAAKDYVDTEFTVQLTNIIKRYPKLGEFFRWFPQQESKNFNKDQFYKEAYEIVEKDDFDKLANFFAKSESAYKAAKWKCIEGFSRSIALYLRPIILVVDFRHYFANNQIIPLVKLIKDHYLSGKNPKKLKIPDALGFNTPAFNYLKSNPSDPSLNPHLFEFYVYKKLYHHLYRGRAFCNDSISYCDIDVDLIAEDEVEEALKIAEQYGYTKIPIYCGDHLDKKLKELTQAWKNLYQNIDTNLVQQLR